jgi:hypothetical protein
LRHFLIFFLIIIKFFCAWVTVQTFDLLWFLAKRTKRAKPTHFF